MSDFTYRCVFAVGYPIFHVSSSAVVLHRERAGREGAFILASTHLSPFDVPLLIAHAPRHLDFMSIVEMQRRPWVRRFYNLMNTFYVDRSRRDAAAVRVAMKRLSLGRVVAMFPEGNIRPWEQSVLNGGKIRPGVARLAEMAGVPVIPAVVLGSSGYSRPGAWAPLGRTKVGVTFGEAMCVPTEGDRAGRLEAFSAQLAQTMTSLAVELDAAMRERHGAGPLPRVGGSATGAA